MKERKDLIIYLVMVAILFGGGVGLGYYIWGINKQKKPDYKSYLKNTIHYLATIEDKNAMLSKETKSLKNNVGLLNKKASEKQQELEKLSKSLKAKIAALEEKSNELGSVINEKTILEEENVRLKKRVEEITDELNTYIQKTGELEKATDGEKHDKISTQEDKQEKVNGMKEDEGEGKTEINEPGSTEENKKLLKEQQQTDEENIK